MTLSFPFYLFPPDNVLLSSVWFHFSQQQQWCAFNPLTSAHSRIHVGDYSLHTVKCVVIEWLVSIRLCWQCWSSLSCHRVFLLVTIAVSNCGTGFVWSACRFSSVSVAHHIFPPQYISFNQFIFTFAPHIWFILYTSLCFMLSMTWVSIFFYFMWHFRVLFYFCSARCGSQGLT